MFLVAWLAVVFQPCAVAGQVEHDCPHCPTETHEGHHQEALGSSDCTIGGQLGFETRSFQAKLDDVPSHLPDCAGQALKEIDLSPGSGLHYSYASSHIYGSRPPLNILNCVFLK